MQIQQCDDMAPEMDHKGEAILRTPYSGLWLQTGSVIAYLGFSMRLVMFATTGHILHIQRYECGNSGEDTSGLEGVSPLVFVLPGLAFGTCIMLLMKIWLRKTTFLIPQIMCMMSITFVVMTVFSSNTWKKETQDIQEFKERYLALIPLTPMPENAQTQNCSGLNNVQRWQTEYKCCGLESYEDWESKFPGSCLCAGAGSGCVRVGNRHVFEKPCLPAVLSTVGQHSALFWTFMIFFMIIHAFPAFCVVYVVLGGCCWLLCEPGYDALKVWKFKLSGEVERVPVVFFRDENNNQTGEEHGKEWAVRASLSHGEVLDLEQAKAVVGGEEEAAAAEEVLDNPLTMITLPELKRLQEELDPPPVRHQVQWFSLMYSIKTRTFYTVTIEEGSPLLPSNAVLADANKPTRCFWVEGDYYFDVEKVLWPRA